MFYMFLYDFYCLYSLCGEWSGEGGERCEVWAEECGVWCVGCEEWGKGCGVWGVRSGVKDEVCGGRAERC